MIEHVLRTLQVSKRRACAALGQHRSTQRKTPHGRDDEQRLTADIVELARQYGRFGYRRIAELLRFVAKALREWIGAVGARTAYIAPGSPWENGYVESFNARLRDALLRHYGASAPFWRLVAAG